MKSPKVVTRHVGMDLPKCLDLAAAMDPFIFHAARIDYEANVGRGAGRGSRGKNTKTGKGFKSYAKLILGHAKAPNSVEDAATIAALIGAAIAARKEFESPRFEAHAEWIATDEDKARRAAHAAMALAGRTRTDRNEARAALDTMRPENGAGRARRLHHAYLSAKRGPIGAFEVEPTANAAHVGTTANFELVQGRNERHAAHGGTEFPTAHGNAARRGALSTHEVNAETARRIEGMQDARNATIWRRKEDLRMGRELRAAMIADAARPTTADAATMAHAAGTTTEEAMVGIDCYLDGPNPVRMDRFVAHTDRMIDAVQ